MTKNGSEFSQPSLWSPGNTTQGYFYKRFCGQAPCFPFEFGGLNGSSEFPINLDGGQHSIGARL